MITPSYSVTATERVLPKLALDFTTASLDPRVTFARTTDATHPATYVNSSGYVTAATNNQPRFDYDPVAKTCKGLLIEESRTNSVPYSNTFDNVAWTKTANVSAALSSATTYPDGTTTGYLVTTTTGSGLMAPATVTVAAGSTYTFSMYVKYNSGLTNTEIRLVFVGGSAVAGILRLNAQTGALLVSTMTSYSITNAGNGWFRISGTLTDNGTNNSFICQIYTNAETSTANSIFMANAQLEAGAFATSYIPTTSAALTRNADEASMTGTNFTDWWNSTQNTIEFQYLTNLSGTATGNRYIGCVAKDASNYIEICGKNTNAKTIVYQTNAGSFDVSMTGASSIFVGSYNKLIVAMQANNYGFALNSASQGTDTSCSLLSSPTSFEIGRWKEGAITGGYFCGWVQKINAYPQRLTASELSAFTAG